MGLIKEPLNVDFYTTGKQMSEEDQKRVSEYIRQKKEEKKKYQTHEGKNGSEFTASKRQVSHE